MPFTIAPLGHGRGDARRDDSRLRLLMVVPFPPRLDLAHGGRVIAQLLRQLTELHDVALVYQRRADEAPIEAWLTDRCRSVDEVRLAPSSALVAAWRHRLRLVLTVFSGRPSAVSVGHSRDLIRVLRETARTFAPDIIQLEHDLLAYCAPHLRGLAGATVLVCHEPGGRASLDLIGVTRGRQRLAHRLDLLAWKRYWRRTLAAVDSVVVFTARDASSITDAVPAASVVRIPLGIDLREGPVNSLGTDPPSLLFVGGYVHHPNADAAVRLVRSIMPAVRQARPGTRLVLAGAQPTRQMLSAAGADDVITGRVDSVEPFVEAASLVVLPIHLGGGMRVKLLEALVAGKAVVASPIAAAGLDVRDGDQLRIAETDEQFVAVILELLADEDARIRLGQRARRWALENLAWGRRVAQYSLLYRSLLGGEQP
jgi:glycosyltransferase involved in cell wall biosynthesis